MLGINVIKDDDQIIVTWQLAKIEIPIKDITAVELDDSYGGTEPSAIRIGTPYGTTDRVIISTKSNTYILFTTNYTAIQNKINRYREEYAQSLHR
ncbi:SunI/YnzG family protein [Paenibacillus kyungheensis]